MNALALVQRYVIGALHGLAPNGLLVVPRARLLGQFLSKLLKLFCRTFQKTAYNFQ